MLKLWLVRRAKGPSDKKGLASHRNRSILIVIDRQRPVLV